MSAKIAAIALAVVLAVAGYFTMQFFLNHLVEHGIETIGPRLTGTNVELGEVDLTLLSGKGSIRGVVIGNPKNFETDNAFELDEVRVDLALLSVFGGTMVVEEIYIGSPKITYEKKGDTSNLVAITRHIHRVAGGSAPESERPEEQESEPSGDATVRIERFELKDAQVKAQIRKDKTLDVPLPGIELTNLGGADGASVGDVSAEMMDTVTGRVMAAVTKRALSLGAGGRGEDAGEAEEEAPGEAEARPARRGLRARRHEKSESP